MSTTTIVLLAILWGAVLLPGLLRDRRRSPIATVDGFHHAMERLARCDSRTVMVAGSAGRMAVYPRPSAHSVMLEQRRMVLARLVTVSAASLVTALAGGGWWWGLALLATAALGAYCAALRTLAVQRERARRVVPLHPAAGSRADTADTTAPVRRAAEPTGGYRVGLEDEDEALFVGAGR